MPTTRPARRRPAATAARKRPAPAPRKRPAPAASRVVDTPWELEQELRNDEHARVVYDSMPPSHRRAYGKFIEEASRPEARVRRVQQALRMIAQWGAEKAARTAKKR